MYELYVDFLWGFLSLINLAVCFYTFSNRKDNSIIILILIMLSISLLRTFSIERVKEDENEDE